MRAVLRLSRSLRSSCFAGLVALLASPLACSSSANDTASPSAPTTPTGDADGGAAVDTATLPLGDLGAPCAGGCAGSKICTVTDSTCATGNCLFDIRSGTSEAYCTADCSAKACPSGFVCEDVPFKLSRACVRDKSAPPAPDGPRAQGTVTLQGKYGPDGSLTSYQATQKIDVVPTSSLSSTPCGSVYTKAAQRGSPVLQLIVRVCQPSVNALLTFEVPLRTGSFPDGTSFVAPVIGASIGGSNDLPIVTYGASNAKVSGPTIEVTDLSGVQTNALPWTVDKVVAKISGTLPQSYDCASAGGCKNGSDTITVSADLELTHLTTK